MTLTLTWWPLYTNLTHITWRYTGYASMNFLCQGFRKLSSDRQTYIHTYIQTDRTKVIYHATLRVVCKQTKKWWMMAGMNLQVQSGLKVKLNRRRAKWITKLIPETRDAYRNEQFVVLKQKQVSRTQMCKDHIQCSTVGGTPDFGRRTDPVLRSACSRRVTTMWVSRPLQVSQLGQLSLSSFRGR